MSGASIQGKMVGDGEEGKPSSVGQIIGDEAAGFCRSRTQPPNRGSVLPASGEGYQVVEGSQHGPREGGQCVRDGAGQSNGHLGRSGPLLKQAEPICILSELSGREKKEARNLGTGLLPANAGGAWKAKAKHNWAVTAVLDTS